MQVRREDVGIFIDRAVLDHGLGTAMDLEQLVQPAVEKIDLQLKAPAGHVLVKIVQVRIVVHIFELRDPFVLLAQQLGQRGLTCANITGNCYMLGLPCFSHRSRQNTKVRDMEAGISFAEGGER